EPVLPGPGLADRGVVGRTDGREGAGELPAGLIGHGPILRPRRAAEARPTASATPPRPTRRPSRTARRTSSTRGALPPSPRFGRRSRWPPYTFAPPRRTPNAPAAAASGRPAFGLGCLPPSLRSTSHARRVEPPTAGAASTVSRPVTRAGTRLATSSRRAAIRPKRRYLGDVYPT